MVVIKKTKKMIDEEEAQNNNTEQNNQSNQNQQKSVALNTQIAQLINKKLQLKTQYQSDIKNIENQIVQLQKQKAELGEDIDPSSVEESMKTRFGKKLFESVTNRTDEMYAAIMMAFGNIDISVKPTPTRCRTFARNIISFLNRMYIKSGGDSSQFDTFVRNLLNNSRVSLSNDEKTKFIKEFGKVLKDNKMFSWIYAESDK